MKGRFVGDKLYSRAVNQLEAPLTEASQQHTVMMAQGLTQRQIREEYPQHLTCE